MTVKELRSFTFNAHSNPGASRKFRDEMCLMIEVLQDKHGQTLNGIPLCDITRELAGFIGITLNKDREQSLWANVVDYSRRILFHGYGKPELAQRAKTFCDGLGQILTLTYPQALCSFSLQYALETAQQLYAVSIEPDACSSAASHVSRRATAPVLPPR